MKTINLSFLFLFGLSSIFSQELIVNDADLPEAEIHAAVNPTNKDNVVIAVQHGYLVENGGHRLSIYYTFDFGETWNSSDYTGVGEGDGSSGDPVLAFDANGDFLLVNLSASGIFDGNAVLNSILSKSSDGGATWSHLLNVEEGFSEKPWIATDRFGTSPNLGNVYVCAISNDLSVKLRAFDDNYELIHTFQATTPQGITQIPSVAVKKDGTVFTSGLELDQSNNTMVTVIVKEYSLGGGSPTIVHSTTAVTFPHYSFGQVPDISERFNHAPYLAIDNSGGTYDGRLYLSYTASEATNPDYFDIYLTYSDDNGNNWSTPKVVHGSPDESKYLFFSSLFVNDQGVLILDWFDRRNHENTNKNTDFFLGVSHDGGESFSETQLNSVSSNFEFAISSSNDFGVGDYQQLVANDTEALSFWADGRNNDGDMNIYLAKVNLETLTVEEHNLISDMVDFSPFYPQPAENLISSTLTASQPIELRYSIFDILGKKVLESPWLSYFKGSSTFSIPIGSLSSGTYVLTIKSKDGLLVKKQKLLVGN